MNMKRLNKFTALVLALCTISAVASAETKGEKDTSNKDENGKTVRGPYLSNRFIDNTFVGAAWGMNMFSQSKIDFKARVTPTALDVYLGKWFTPSVGLRLAYTGLTGSENSTKTIPDSSEKLIEKFGFAYVHGDVLWNISNTIGGFREDRLWNFVPYLHAGYLRLYDVRDDANAGTDDKHDSNEKDNEVAGGVGLLNLIHVHKRLNLTLDVRDMLFSGRFHNWDKGGVCNGFTATLGLQVLIGNTRFDRVDAAAAAGAAAGAGALAAAEAALAAAQAALAKSEEDNKALADANKNLTDDNNNLNDDKKDLADQLAKALANAGAAEAAGNAGNADNAKSPLDFGSIKLYFRYNQSTLTPTEKAHLRYYLDAVLAKNPDAEFYVTGCADKSTGTEEFNVNLSKERAENTIDLLVDEYGISRDKIHFRDSRILDDNKNELSLDRFVLIEF